MDFYAVSNQQTLDIIARHCPRALPTYLTCLYRANEDGSLFLKKEEISNELSESYTKFKNNLKKLAQENLLEWKELQGGLHIIMADTEVNLGDYA